MYDAWERGSSQRGETGVRLRLAISFRCVWLSFPPHTDTDRA